VFTKRNIPNLLTMLRLVLATAFFVILAYYKYDQDQYMLLLPAIGLFIAAALTDAMDGYYARKWDVESKFGRIMDPFCDKVLVLGALCFLAGASFGYEDFVESADGNALPVIVQASGVYAWMVVIIIARELLVTGIRGEMEGSGHKFGANLWGKLKMILQSVVVPIVLLIVFVLDQDKLGHLAYELALVRDVLVYATVVVTVLSGLPYVTGAYRVAKAEQAQK
jgi:CDP-diacylglycerol--glycerol-3-phosphate 3-phosphatidyltransferase